MTFVTLFLLALTVEALVEYGKLIFQKTINWKQLAAMALGILLSIGAQTDLFAALGVTFVIPYLGCIITGILFSRGANYLADFLKVAQTYTQKG